MLFAFIHLNSLEGKMKKVTKKSEEAVKSSKIVKKPVGKSITKASESESVKKGKKEAKSLKMVNKIPTAEAKQRAKAKK